MRFQLRGRHHQHLHAIDVRNAFAASQLDLHPGTWAPQVDDAGWVMVQKELAFDLGELATKAH